MLIGSPLRKHSKQLERRKHSSLLADYFLAAKGSMEKEIEQGKMQVDACKEANCDFVVYSSAADVEYFNEKVKHIKGKGVVEKYLKSSGLRCTVLRPVAFFENYDDPANWNPLKKGHVKFLSMAKVKLCAAYDIGQAAAICFKKPEEWNGKTMDIASWEGDPNDVAKALQNVTGTKTTAGLAMPLFLRYLFLSDLHNMCLYFEKDGGFKANIETFKSIVPTAMSAEDWFRKVGEYSNGEKFPK